MSDQQPVPSRWRGALAMVAAAVVLSACGGGDGGSANSGYPATCSVTDRNLWMSSYLDDWYFWYRLRPHPDPYAYGDTTSFFDDSLYTGVGDTHFPKADVWSYGQRSADFNQFWGNGVTMGYGVMVAGREVAGFPDSPLYVRYVEPGSPADGVLLRGDQIVSVNDLPARTMISSNDFSALTATQSGQSVKVVYRDSQGDWQVTLTSATYALAPVSARVVTSPQGRKVGYVMVKDMVQQALAPLDNVFAQFKAQGVRDVVLDLRYNGGGLVSTAARIASYPAGAATAGQVYTRLLYNDRHRDSNASYAFDSLSNATQLNRVYVLTGMRTCSASEQLINGLRPFVQVVTIGDTTCGKPVGFSAIDDGCGTTWSAVNFESVNANNEGRFFDGFDATCPVAEDFTQALGTSGEPLLQAALNHADTGACSSTLSSRAQPFSVKRRAVQQTVVEPGDRGGMLVR